MLNIINNPKPVIAEVKIANAADCQLVATCDLAY